MMTNRELWVVAFNKAIEVAFTAPKGSLKIGNESFHPHAWAVQIADLAVKMAPKERE